jgi:arylsulfatase A-like enzyme
MKNKIVAGAVLLAGIAVAERPNIVWIFSDDHSYQTIGAYGGRLKELNMSPNLDKIAAEGMRFERAYVGNSICAPSRATLLTGKHSHMNGKLDNVDPFNHDQQQFQKILQKNGYQTVMIGKIHLYGKMQGFDYWEVLPGQGNYDDPVFITEEGKTTYPGRYVTDVITERALSWLENDRDKEKPFMLMIHHKAPHRNWIPAAEDMERYEDVEIPEPDNLFDDYATRGVAAQGQAMEVDRHLIVGHDLKINDKEWYGDPKKSSWSKHYFEDPRFAKRSAEFNANPPTGKDLVKWKYQTYMKDYLRCTWAVDESIGEVVEALEKLGLDDNTIVMYSSDQGFYMGEHGWFDKRFMYEESFRTPFIAKWPGKIKPGSVNTDLVQNIDFAETFLDLAGAPIPDDMQGKSLVPLLKGETPKDWRDALYYHYYEYPGPHGVRRHEGVFDGRWKLIRFYGKNVPDGEEWEFYDLKNDPTEMNNIFANPESKAQIEVMKKKLESLKEQYQVPEDTAAAEAAK